MTPTQICGLALVSALNVPADRIDVVDRLAAYGNKDLLVLAYIESSYRQDVVSHAGAVGVMQLTPIAVREVYAVGCDRPLPDKPDVTTLQDNLLIGYCFWQHLLGIYEGNRLYALAHYNGGSRAVNLIKRGRLPPPETIGHIVKFYRIKEGIEECVD